MFRAPEDQAYHVKIGRMMSKFFYVVARQGAMQIVVMAKFVSGL